MEFHWRDYGAYLLSEYGVRVYRIGIDGGFSCPNRDSSRHGGCIYCDAKGSSAVYQRRAESRYTRKSPLVHDIDQLTEKVYECPSLDDRLTSIDVQISRGRAYLDSRFPHTGRSIYFQAFTNTYAPVEELQIIYDRALQEGNYYELIVSTRPDCISEEVVSLLHSYKNRVQKVWVELGLQSGNDKTLAWIERGHTVDDYIRSCELLAQKDIHVCTHVILGFPCEQEQDILLTAQVIAHTHPQAVKIHNLHVVVGTALHTLYEDGGCKVGTMEDHLKNTIVFLRHIPSDIVIQRLVSDTPSHRLVAPRDFGDKGVYIARLAKTMEELSVWQGDCV